MTARIIVVTGTSTDVGKTVVTAALAALAVAASERVVVVKPAQTGVATGDPTDADVVHALTGVEGQEWTRLDEPLAPDTAARRAGVEIPPVAYYAERVAALAGSYDLVIVEGAGGVLVRLDTDGGTIIELASALEDRHRVQVVVVCGAGLGTLNHTELTVAALESWGIGPAALVIGSWPADPDLAERCNLLDLPEHTSVPLLGVVPAGSGSLSQTEFLAAAPQWLAAWTGRFGAVRTPTDAARGPGAEA